MQFKALIVSEESGIITQQIGCREALPLGADEVRIRVHYSSLNYKDALSATGNKGVTKHYPHTPGIDASGIIAESRSSLFKEGDRVLVTGYDLGMNTPGGFAEYIQVPAAWVVPLPERLSLKDAMLCGTAGFTAGLAKLRLEQNGLLPGSKPVLVTGATGGVGSFAVALFSAAGYQVTAATRKQSQHEFLKTLGAAGIIDSADLITAAVKPLSKGLYSGAVDTVGGTVLQGALASCDMFASVASCGLTQSAFFSTSVFPFILRGNNLLGINSAETPMVTRQLVWQQIQQLSPLQLPEQYAQQITLEELPALFSKILQGEVCGRYIIYLGD